MSGDTKSIHEFDFTLICEYFSSLERQGPGSQEITMRALGFIDNLNDASKIVDLGCGTGGQTLVLARETRAEVIGVDLFPKFIDIFNDVAYKNGLQDRLRGIVGSMDDLKFAEEEFDVVWSEGAIYNIGFERGLREWRKYLKKGGYIAVSEASWFTAERPLEIESFWNEAYPEIDIVSNKVRILEETGFSPVAVFVLPENCWIENYHAPQRPVQEAFLKKHPGDSTAEKLVKYQIHEAELYKKYKEYYGYVFYIGKRMD